MRSPLSRTTCAVLTAQAACSPWQVRSHVSDPLRPAGGAVQPHPQYRLLLRPAASRRGAAGAQLGAGAGGGLYQGDRRGGYRQDPALPQAAQRAGLGSASGAACLVAQSPPHSGRAAHRAGAGAGVGGTGSERAGSDRSYPSSPDQPAPAGQSGGGADRRGASAAGRDAGGDPPVRQSRDRIEQAAADRAVRPAGAGCQTGQAASAPTAPADWLLLLPAAAAF